MKRANDNISKAAENKRKKRANETEEARQKRLEYQRNYNKKNASSERAATLRKRDAEYKKRKRANATAEQREDSRNYQHNYHRNYRANMDEEKTERQRQVRIQREAVPRQRSAAKLYELAINCLQNESLVESHYCGQMKNECSKCFALHFEAEKFRKEKVFDESGNESTEITYTKCCQNGQVQLPSLREYPSILENLMKQGDNVSKNFMENIRSINSSFGFASMGMKIAPPPGRGPYCLRVHGAIHHITGTLHPAEGDSPSYSQLYIFDSSAANDQRASHSANQSIDPKLFEILDTFLRNENPLVGAYKMLHEVEQQSKREAEENGVEELQVSMAIVEDRSKDHRRYNAQSCNDVAVVFQSTDGLPPVDRDIIIHCRANANDPSKGMQRLKMISPNLEPMTYPILFPYGEQGWGIGIERNSKGNRKNVTLKEYLCYRLASRRNTFNPLLNAGKLTQEYFVNGYTRMEAGRLDYIRNNQETLRGSNLNGLRDFVAGDNENSSPGQAYVLPSSFPGGPRYMQQTYQDSMAIVTKFGKPDLFITMTSNPKWKEISENLEPWQSAENRPDLVTQVFQLKLSQMLDDIVKPDGGIFGKVLAYVWVIEFQKRGLPHAHILIILDKDSKPNTGDKIDMIVRAEIPEQNCNPRLFDIVTSCMVHTPCGKHSKSSSTLPCMKGGVYQKQFPKPFQQETICGDDGYAKYRRRETPKVKIGKNEVDNGFIVPYNPYLLLKYNCHINVEVCASIKSVKYLYKYIFKGHDCAYLEIADKKNEIKTYVDARYVSAPESAWRIAGFDILEVGTRGLLLDDDVWKLTIQDAIAFSMPPQLRNVFAYICVFSEPSSPKDLWVEYMKHFTEDFCLKIYRNTGECQNCEDYALRDLQSVLRTHGSTLESLGLREPLSDLPEIDNSIDVRSETSIAASMIATLNMEQRNAFDEIVRSSDNSTNSSRCFFIDGPGGSGKTYLYTTLTHYFRGRGLTVLSTATTGIAANLLIDGRTMHSMFKLQISNHEGTKCNVMENTPLWNKIRKAALIILDECTMASCHQVNALSATKDHP